MSDVEEDEESDPWDGWRGYWCEWCGGYQFVPPEKQPYGPWTAGKRWVCRICLEDPPWNDEWTRYRTATRRRV